MQCANSLVSGAPSPGTSTVCPAPDPSLTMHVTNGISGYHTFMTDQLTWFTTVLTSDGPRWK
jgi:hypothetical protein